MPFENGPESVGLEGEKKVGMGERGSDLAGLEGEKKIGLGKQVLEGAKGWVWWGKPLWHDLGYVAVRLNSLVNLQKMTKGSGFGATICCIGLLDIDDVRCPAVLLFWLSSHSTGLPGVIPRLNSDDGSVPIVDVFFWTPQGIFNQLDMQGRQADMT